METEQIQEVRKQKNWNRGSVKYLIELVGERFDVMRALEEKYKDKFHRKTGK